MSESTIPVPGSFAPSLLLQRADGSPVELAQLWAERPVVLFFVRHFGCVFCRDELMKLRDRYDEAQARGVEIVAITPSDPINSMRFAGSLHLPFPVLADLRRQAFAAYGLVKTTVSELIRPEVVARVVRQLARGNLPLENPLASSVTQLGGVFAVDRSGVVRLSHLASPVYSHPDLTVCLNALEDRPRDESGWGSGSVRRSGPWL